MALITDESVIFRAEAGSDDTVMDAHMQNAVNADINLFIAHISFLVYISLCLNYVQPKNG
jgi:putative NIF3 family GTP cyclohydrolase 1 type 2